MGDQWWAGLAVITWMVVSSVAAFAVKYLRGVLLQEPRVVRELRAEIVVNRSVVKSVSAQDEFVAYAKANRAINKAEKELERHLALHKTGIHSLKFTLLAVEVLLVGMLSGLLWSSTLELEVPLTPSSMWPVGHSVLRCDEAPSPHAAEALQEATAARGSEPEGGGDEDSRMHDELLDDGWLEEEDTAAVALDPGGCRVLCGPWVGTLYTCLRLVAMTTSGSA